ncbi:hypothetical protein [Nostoc sp. DedQUE07]|nr:hypothetical protein [Nostoc sp. DedQUE07]MDZ8129255.1 hypothetical protein [Nostoc sp. DedQUE07]
MQTRPPLTQGARNWVLCNCASAIAIWLISLRMSYHVRLIAY